MTRLMCSSDRKEVEGLKSELFRAGIRCEISSNPVASAPGILRFEIHIYDSDFIEASRIQKEFLAAWNNEWASNGGEKSSGNGQANREVRELLVEPGRLQLGPPSRHDQPAGGHQDSSGIELAQAAVLLEKEVEEVLARDRQLDQQCAALQDQVKASDESLAQVHAELARASSERSAAEQKLAEASAARGSLQKELDRMNLRFKTAEQSLAAAQGQLESLTRELKLQQTKVGDLSKEVASRDSQLGTLVESLAQTRAALENENGLRQVAEQKVGEHAAARKSLEQQLDHLAELQAQLQDQNQHEREQIQGCLDAVNKLRCRLSQKRTAPQER